METADRPARIMAVGSCDLDNFGDLLFLLVTEQYLRDAEVVPAGPFGWDMTGVMDRKVEAYGPLLNDEDFDVIWTVGGERATRSLEIAFSISAPNEVYDKFVRSSPSQRNETLRRFAGHIPDVEPYMPSPISYPRNAGTISVVNSVGISHLLEHEASRNEHIAMLRGTTFLSVRDKESSELLNRLGIDHRLAPDAVHSLGVIQPANRDTDSDIAIFQINGTVQSMLGVKNVGDALLRSRNLRGLRIRVLVAGTFRGSDSVESDLELIDYIKQTEPRTDIELIEDRQPMALVDHIKAARVVIGTSQHLQIVANAYKVPRVALATLFYNKVSRYCRFWDPYMPTDVKLEDLDNAVGVALANGELPEAAKISETLSQQAHENLQFLTRSALGMVKSQTPESKARRAEVRQNYRTMA